VDSRAVFTRIFILHDDIRATRMVIPLSAEELNTMSKNNLGLKPVWEINYLIFQPFLVRKEKDNRGEIVF